MAKNEHTEADVTNGAAENVKPEQERVEIYIERGAANDDPNLFVSVNGVNYLLPRGKTSKVPRHIAEEIHRSRRAQTRQDRNIDAMKNN